MKSSLFGGLKFAFSEASFTPERLARLKELVGRHGTTVIRRGEGFLLYL